MCREWIATTSKDFTVRVWRVRDSKNVAIGTGHTDSVGAVCFSKRNHDYGLTSRSAFLCTGAGDKILKRWNVPIAVLDAVSSEEQSEVMKLGCTHSVRAHEKDINTIAISPNDAIIASGSQDKTIKLWRSSDLSAVHTLSGHKRGVWRVVFSPVDKSLASCSGDRTVKLWSVADYSCLVSLVLRSIFFIRYFLTQFVYIYSVLSRVTRDQFSP
jgi:U3 small nucleolar RNA-associated protein 13